MATRVYVRTTFAACHRWQAAPEETAFLRNWHRHLFHVKVTVSVTHDDRRVEFFSLKKRVEDYILFNYAGAYFELSCEQIASDLLRALDADEIEVSEDGENGAIVRGDNS